MLTLHLLGHVYNLSGWEATLAAFILMFHDIILWPVFLLIGVLTGRKTIKGESIKKPRKVKIMTDGQESIAHVFTNGMATWTFIFVFLLLCLTEIVLNKLGILHFDPSTWYLNLFLSLIAAIQGSIIMIDQRAADAKRDHIINRTLELEEAQTQFEESMDGRLSRIEKALKIS